MNSVFPSAYFGSIAYFKRLVNTEQPIGIEAFEHMVKQSLRSRCKILSANGIIDLSIPLIKVNGNKTPITQIEVDDSKAWRDIHWKSIKSAYSSAPYFEHYSPKIEALIFQDERSLLDLNMTITHAILKELDHSIDLQYTKAYELHQFPENAALCLKNDHVEPLKAPYIQVFTGDRSYMESLSILDALFCEGPMVHNMLIQV